MLIQILTMDFALMKRGKIMKHKVEFIKGFAFGIIYKKYNNYISCLYIIIPFVSYEICFYSKDHIGL